MGLMDIPELFLKLWGLWPIDTLETPRKRKIYLAYRVIVIGWYSAFNFSYFIGTLRIIIDQEPFERISKCLSVFVSIGLLLWKGLIYLRNNIAQICIQVRGAETALRNSADQNVKVAYTRTEASNKYLNVYIIGSTFSTLVAYAGVSCIEVYNTGPDYWKMDNVSFMHEIYLPIDKLKWRWWIMVANIATACESVVVNIAVQSSFCTLVMYGSLRLKVLRIGMQRFHYSPCGGVNMKSFVVEHLDSIRYIDDLNEATKSILFITFLLNSIKVASVLFPLMAVKSLSALAFPAIFSSMLVAEVFYLGWICNEVKEQSLKISTDAYKILWYNENKDVSVLLQMMIRRAQRPLTMQMGPFGPMVTDTILSTMKAAYSYTTLMLNARE